LLEAGSDRRFRALVYDLFTIAARMETVREHLGARIGITGPQYSVMMAVGHLQGEIGASVGAVAQAMHVSSAFIAAETGKLARLGLLSKRTNPEDRRGVLVRLTPAGRVRVDRVSGEIRGINDRFFGGLDQQTFAMMGKAAARLVAGSSEALRYVGTLTHDADLVPDAAE
jgi:DNA-binding MarR family transcriptional regulator